MHGMCCSCPHPQVMQAAALQVLPGHKLLHGQRLHRLSHLLKAPPPALAARDPAALLAPRPPPLLPLLVAPLEACDEQAPECGPEAVPLHLRGCSRRAFRGASKKSEGMATMGQEDMLMHLPDNKAQRSCADEPEEES